MSKLSISRYTPWKPIESCYGPSGSWSELGLSQARLSNLCSLSALFLYVSYRTYRSSCADLSFWSMAEDIFAGEMATKWLRGIHHLERDTPCRCANIRSYNADQMHMLCDIVFHRQHTKPLWHGLLFQL